MGDQNAFAINNFFYTIADINLEMGISFGIFRYYGGMYKWMLYDLNQWKMAQNHTKHILPGSEGGAFWFFICGICVVSSFTVVELSEQCGWKYSCN